MMSLDQIASIQFLSQDVQNQLRSGVATPSVVQCVEELVVNSIDAEASCIAVRVHLPDCQIQVVDNGRGMTKDDMLCVGERYATSKCHNTKDLEDISHYGYRGEALASIKEISSVLEITSRARGSELTYSKLFHHGKDQGVTKASKVRLSGGTTVTARNVFYNLPVRRKMLSSPLVYEQICKQLQAISLIHPQISLTLRNDSTGVKSIQTHHSSSVVQTFGYLFGKDVVGGLKEVNHIHAVFNISGFIGSTSHRNKSLQFVYVNGRLILKTKIHKLVNELLSNSLVTKSKGKNQNMSQGYSMSATCQPSPGGNQMEYGIFVLNITCCRNEYDITFDPAKTLVEFRDWEGVVTCVHELVTSFLERENLTMKFNVAQTGSEAGRSNLIIPNETEVCASVISTTDCKNAVQSTCVRRQIVQPDVSTMLNNLNPCNIERVEEDKADSHTTNNSDRIPDAFGDVNKIRETEIPQPDACDTNKHVDTNKHMEEVLTAYASDHSDPNADPHCQLSEETLVNRPMPKTPDDKKDDSSQNMKSLTSNLSCNREGSAAISAAHWTPPSSELDVGSSEETLTSSEVEIGTPKSGVHQCCDARCLSMRRDDTDSGQEVVDLVSPRTRIAVKARNTLSMFRRSVKKKKMTKAAKDDSSQKSEQKVNKHLQSASANEHKTIALRWYRSPGFRSTLESLNIKCKDRQEQVDMLQRLSSSSGPSQSNGHTNAFTFSSESGSSMKEACLSNQQAIADEKSKLGNQAKTHMADDNNAPGLKVNEKENACLVIIENKKCNPSEHMKPHDSEEQNIHDAPKGGCTKNTNREHWERQRSDSNMSDLPRHSTMELTNSRKIADPPDSPISSKAWKQSSGCNLRERMESYVQDSEGQLVDVAARDDCIESSSREHCERKSIVVNTSYIPRNSTLESTPTLKRVADPPDSPVSSKWQKLTSGLQSSASAEVPVKFLTSTSFMVSACEVFDRETLQSSSPTDDCTQISNEELEQSTSEGVRAASDDCQVPLPVQERPCTVLETEPFTVEIADGALDLCEIVNEKGTLGNNTTHWMEEDTTGINARDITEMNEFDTMADSGQSAIKIFQTDHNDNELKENNAEMTTDPGTYMDEDSGLLDASDPDDSISLFHIPHHDEERTFCLDTVVVAPENRDDSTATKNDARENSIPKEAPLSSKSTNVHGGRDQFGINIDLAPIQHSCLEDIHSIKICKGADENVPSAVEVPEIQVSSEGNPATESEIRMCESSYTTQREDMDTKDSSGRNDPDGKFVIESREWYSVYDASRGRKIFINRFNGNCSSDKPDDLVLNQDSRQINVDHQFTMVTKNDTLAHPHLPHSAAPFVNNLRDKKESSSHSHDPPVTPATLATVDAAMEESQEEDDELSIVKWGKRSQISGDSCNEGPQFSKYNQEGTGYGFLTSVSEGFPNIDVKFQAKVLASLNPCQFTKGMFASMKVLGQVDKKFIACLVNSDYEKNPAGEPNLLILVDQHAAHERIRLEMLTQDAYTSHCDNPDDSNADQTRCIRTSDVTPALPISLSSSELRLLEAYPQKMKRIGIAYQLSEDSALVTRLPACVVEKEANELKRGRQTIATSVAETLIKEVLDSLQHQSGAVSSLPKTITRILNSQACHGAIKFGDTLDLAECKTLIGQLSSCDLPFQCAHGRPALMPILDFKKIKHANRKKVTPSPPQVWKLKYLTSGMNIQG
ncbi:DNA mismatch repair protein Mlh3-like [Lytechinus pictus]|uniref:DNA mismatch repair protein Mlh3-like n=1 Tax=Lytechinus pictus TaxID=7653 RepID=UPI0030BA20B3